MDRRELRFRILFEYYRDLHSQKLIEDGGAMKRIRNMKISEDEKRPAQIWLIESGYVNGKNIAIGANTFPAIDRINSRGIDFIESVMNETFIKINEPSLNELSNLGKIKKFTEQCFESPYTTKICKIAFDVILCYIKSGGN